MRMLIALICLGVFSGASETPASSDRFTAEVTFDNRFGETADLYVGFGDDNRCRALNNLHCSTHVQAGPITLVARSAIDRRVLFSESGTIADGSSVTWPAWQ
jgi:hypothetical protein